MQFIDILKKKKCLGHADRLTVRVKKRHSEIGVSCSTAQRAALYGAVQRFCVTTQTRLRLCFAFAFDKIILPCNPGASKENGSSSTSSLASEQTVLARYSFSLNGNLAYALSDSGSDCFFAGWALPNFLSCPHL